MNGDAIDVRPERPEERDRIYRVHAAAFPTESEAELVDALRDVGDLCVSLVALDDGAVVGHIAFSPVTVGTGGGTGVGLGPVAVRPALARHGIGSQLIRTGLAACARAGYGFVVVLGEPEFYERFGFRRAADFGLGNEYGVDREFMALELASGALEKVTGTVTYPAAFKMVA
jgi:putative acetyltransferase